MIVAEEIKVMKRRHRLPPHCLRFAPALPLRGTSLREDGLHEAEAVRPSNSELEQSHYRLDPSQQPLHILNLATGNSSEF